MQPGWQSAAATECITRNRTRSRYYDGIRKYRNILRAANRSALVRYGGRSIHHCNRHRRTTRAARTRCNYGVKLRGKGRCRRTRNHTRRKAE